MCAPPVTRDRQAPAAAAVHPGQIAAGMVLAAVGIVIFVDRLQLFDVSAMALLPGLVVMGVGVLRITCTGERRRAVRGSRIVIDGLWTITVGVWLMANAVHTFGWTYGTSWPYLLTAAGVFLVARAWGR